MNPKPLMKCGHQADSINPIDGLPACSLCTGLTPDANVLAGPIPLEGRRARCKMHVESVSKRTGKKMSVSAFCSSEEPSSYDLSFFELRLMDDFDLFDCGCRH